MTTLIDKKIAVARDFLFTYTDPKFKYNGVSGYDLAKRLVDMLEELNIEKKDPRPVGACYNCGTETDLKEGLAWCCMNCANPKSD